MISKRLLRQINVCNAGNDFRISVQIEQPQQHFDERKLRLTRHKKRKSFRCKYLSFDFTQTVDESFNGDLSDKKYEVEVEITDLKHVLNYVDDVKSYYAIIERYM